MGSLWAGTAAHLRAELVLAQPHNGPHLLPMPLRFTMRQIEYFVAVGEAGSIARAAEKLSVSSPSISAALGQLEQEFGVQLFIRHHAQGLSLTPGGCAVLKQARVLLYEADRLHQVAGDIAQKPRGPLALGCLVTIAPLVLAPLRRRFETAHPEARVSHVVADHARLLDLLRRAEVDVALTYDLQIPEDIAFQPLARLAPNIVVAQDHPLAQAASVTVESLVSEPLVLLDLPVSREYFMSMFHAHGLRPRIAERTSDLATMLSLVANGYGYGLLSLRSRLDQAPDGRVVAKVPLADAPRLLTMGLATMRGEHESGIMRAFRQHSEQEITDERIPGMAPPL